jgi:phosphatidyl-myo-inositol alpha-mannosyltransferase
MKIGLVCPYNISRGGGVQECVFALQAELNRRGHQSKIITPLPRDFEGKQPENVIFIGSAAQVKSFHTTSQISVSVGLEAVDTMLFEEQFDVLHFHEPWVPFASRQILSRSASVNIATFHAKLPETMMNRTIERVITPYTKSIMKDLHALTAVSESAAEYVHALTKKRVNIIPNGIDLKEYSSKDVRPGSTLPRQSSNKSKPRKVILYVGRLEKRKGLPYLLKAYRLLSEQHRNISLVIAGDGPDRLKLENWVQDNNLQRVKFKGYITAMEKRRLMRSSNLFCSPARYGESFGIVLLEAMASGLVTVAGNNSGYTSVLKGRGALSIINPKDTVEFSRRMELLLYDDGLASLWRQWADHYVKKFDYAVIVDQYEQLYKTAINK